MILGWHRMISYDIGICIYSMVQRGNGAIEHGHGAEKREGGGGGREGGPTQLIQ